MKSRMVICANPKCGAVRLGCHVHAFEGKYYCETCIVILRGKTPQQQVPQAKLTLWDKLPVSWR